MSTDAEPSGLRWALSPAVASGVAAGIVCLVAGFVFARADLALVGVPLLLSAAVGWDRRPGALVPVRVSARGEPAEDAADDGRRRVTLTGAVEADAHIDAVVARWELPGGAPFDTVVSAGFAARMPAVADVVHTGPQRLLRLAGRAVGPDAAFVTEPSGSRAVDRVVRPRAVPMRSLPLPPRLTGLTGPHPSARPGEGGEFRDVDRFQPGDRLRRIDWRATARRAQLPGELFVRRTLATSDAAVHLVVDSRDDVTGRVLDWAAPYPAPGVSSQDLAREAAASLATAYSGAGDRVGFDDLADAGRTVPPRSGRRHLHRVLLAAERTAARGPAGERVRPPAVAAGALVYVLSTFLDDQPMRLALTWSAAGHRVVAVDVLPARLVRDLPRRDALALRVVELERTLRFRRLTAGGVDLLTWQDPAGDRREARLRELTVQRRRR